MNYQRPNFQKIAATERGFAMPNEQLVGPTPTIAITPVADGREGAYESNVEGTWRMVEKVYDLITSNVRLRDGSPVRVVLAPEIVYGARTGAIAQKYYAEQNVSANIWVSRSWAYSEELMSACMGIGSSEWQQAAYGLNQTNRPGAVWLKAFTAAMDEKKRPIFSIYSPDLEDEDGPLNDYVAERLLRFARCAVATAVIRGKNYLSIGSVSMGIIGSDLRRNILQNYFGMGAISYDMVGVQGRMANEFYDHEELEQAVNFMKKFNIDYGSGKRPADSETLLRNCCKMALIVRDLMVGNPRLAEREIEFAQGANAIVAGTQGQRQWTDLYPNFDLPESILNSSFDWNGFRAPYLVATENDSKNGIGMLLASLLSGMPQLFADIRTNWTPRSIKEATGEDVSDVAPQGIIDKRNSGAAALDYAINVLKIVPDGDKKSIQQVRQAILEDPALQKEIIKQAVEATTYMGANLEYFRGDGLSSSFRTPGGIPLTAYRYNVIGDIMTCSVVEGQTAELPRGVADHINQVTDSTWPESFWAPFNMSSFEYMDRIGPNHDANSFGLIGDDMITLNSMLRIPVDLHNVEKARIFRPTFWDRCGGDDFRACQLLGPVYG